MAIITISRGSRSGGQALAECLGRHLNYPVVGREILQEAATKLGVSVEAVGQGMQYAPKLWARRTLSRKMYVMAVQAALAERIVDGNLVYHGLAGQMLLRGVPAVLRVRLVAPLEVRVRALMKIDGMDRSSAEKYIEDVDDGRRRWVQMMYDREIADPGLYDTIINLETMTLQSACLMLGAVLQQPEFAVTREVKARLMDFCLECRIRLALLGDAETQGMDLTVEVRDGVAEVSGSAALLPDNPVDEDIARITRAVPGVNEVRLKIEWFGP